MFGFANQYPNGVFTLSIAVVIVQSVRDALVEWNVLTGLNCSFGLTNQNIMST